MHACMHCRKWNDSSLVTYSSLIDLRQWDSCSSYTIVTRTNGMISDGGNVPVMKINIYLNDDGWQVSILSYLLTVKLQVRRPLSPTHLSPEQVGLEMLCLCGQLDLLVRAQVQQVCQHCFLDAEKIIMNNNNHVPIIGAYGIGGWVLAWICFVFERVSYGWSVTSSVKGTSSSELYWSSS